MDFHHISVLMEETLAALAVNPAGTYVDCTLGGGGHAGGIAARLGARGRLIGIDQDPAAIAAGGERLANAACRVDLVNRNFAELSVILRELDAAGVDGILFDLGVSSHQLDVAERGFSYMRDAPLDMRMNPAAGLSAAEVVNTYGEAELARVIAGYGEERWAKRIARFIVAARAAKPLTTTGELVEAVKRAIPAAARREGPHPAKRTFQAIRIEVNGELDILERAFADAVDALRPGGRLCIITFHSLEDRIAKKTLQSLAKGCICPPRLPVCACGRRPRVRLLGRPTAPTAAETAENARSRSAKLRAAEKL